MAVHDPDRRVADRIARAVRDGRSADRVPTVAQLLRAFGESDDTPAARGRVARALALSGVAVTPALEAAPADRRVELEAAGRRRRAWWPWALAALALGALAAGLVAAWPGEKTRTRTVAGAPPPAVTLPAETVTVAAPAPTPRVSAAARRRARLERAAAERRRRARAPVTVRVSAAAPTFLCAEDGAGRRLFDGNLAGTRTFRARVVRLNVGLASTRVLANGRPVPLAGSPTGVRISRGHSSFLPLGARPCA